MLVTPEPFDHGFDELLLTVRQIGVAGSVWAGTVVIQVEPGDDAGGVQLRQVGVPRIEHRRVDAVVRIVADKRILVATTVSTIGADGVDVDGPNVVADQLIDNRLLASVGVVKEPLRSARAGHEVRLTVSCVLEPVSAAVDGDRADTGGRIGTGTV